MFFAFTGCQRPCKRSFNVTQSSCDYPWNRIETDLRDFLLEVSPSDTYTEWIPVGVLSPSHSTSPIPSPPRLVLTPEVVSVRSRSGSETWETSYLTGCLNKSGTPLDGPFRRERSQFPLRNLSPLPPSTLGNRRLSCRRPPTHVTRSFPLSCPFVVVGDTQVRNL